MVVGLAAALWVLVLSSDFSVAAAVESHCQLQSPAGHPQYVGHLPPAAEEHPSSCADGTALLQTTAEVGARRGSLRTAPSIEFLAALLDPSLRRRMKELLLRAPAAPPAGRRASELLVDGRVARVSPKALAQEALAAGAPDPRSPLRTGTVAHAPMDPVDNAADADVSERTPLLAAAATSSTAAPGSATAGAAPTDSVKRIRSTVSGPTTVVQATRNLSSMTGLDVRAPTEVVATKEEPADLSIPTEDAGLSEASEASNFEQAQMHSQRVSTAAKPGARQATAPSDLHGRAGAGADIDTAGDAKVRRGGDMLVDVGPETTARSNRSDAFANTSATVAVEVDSASIDTQPSFTALEPSKKEVGRLQASNFAIESQSSMQFGSEEAGSQWPSLFERGRNSRARPEELREPFSAGSATTAPTYFVASLAEWEDSEANTTAKAAYDLRTAVPLAPAAVASSPDSKANAAEAVLSNFQGLQSNSSFATTTPPEAAEGAAASLPISQGPLGPALQPDLQPLAPLGPSMEFSTVEEPAEVSRPNMTAHVEAIVKGIPAPYVPVSVVSEDRPPEGQQEAWEIQEEAAKPQTSVDDAKLEFAENKAQLATDDTALLRAEQQAKLQGEVDAYLQGEADARRSAAMEETERTPLADGMQRETSTHEVSQQSGAKASAEVLEQLGRQALAGFVTPGFRDAVRQDAYKRVSQHSVPEEAEGMGNTEGQEKAGEKGTTPNAGQHGRSERGRRTVPGKVDETAQQKEEQATPESRAEGMQQIPQHALAAVDASSTVGGGGSQKAVATEEYMPNMGGGEQKQPEWSLDLDGRDRRGARDSVRSKHAASRTAADIETGLLAEAEQTVVDAKVQQAASAKNAHWYAAADVTEKGRSGGMTQEIQDSPSPEVVEEPVWLKRGGRGAEYAAEVGVRGEQPVTESGDLRNDPYDGSGPWSKDEFRAFYGGLHEWSAAAEAMTLHGEGGGGVRLAGLAVAGASPWHEAPPDKAPRWPGEGAPRSEGRAAHQAQEHPREEARQIRQEVHQEAAGVGAISSEQIEARPSMAAWEAVGDIGADLMKRAGASEEPRRSAADARGAQQTGVLHREAKEVAVENRQQQSLRAAPEAAQGPPESLPEQPWANGDDRKAAWTRLQSRATTEVVHRAFGEETKWTLQGQKLSSGAQTQQLEVQGTAIDAVETGPESPVKAGSAANKEAERLNVDELQQKAATSSRPAVLSSAPAWEAIQETPAAPQAGHSVQQAMLAPRPKAAVSQPAPLVPHQAEFAAQPAPATWPGVREQHRPRALRPAAGAAVEDLHDLPPPLLPASLPVLAKGRLAAVLGRIADSASVAGKACPPGYYIVDGDLLGWEHNGKMDSSTKETAHLCAADCNSHRDCLAFKWSPRTKQCQLNRLASPASSNSEDYMFCLGGSITLTKQHLTLAADGERRLSTASQKSSARGESRVTLPPPPPPPLPPWHPAAPPAKRRPFFARRQLAPSSVQSALGLVRSVSRLQPAPFAPVQEVTATAMRNGQASSTGRKSARSPKLLGPETKHAARMPPRRASDELPPPPPPPPPIPPSA